METQWSPSHWQQEKFQKIQQPKWADTKKLQKVKNQLQKLPPLVFAGEIEKLKASLALAGRGEAFLLQGGSCAEAFEDCTANHIREDLKVLLQMALIMSYAGQKKVIKVGRIAGQYAKPRSSDTEKVGKIELPSYRGDMVNRIEAVLQEREPNAQNLLEGYFYSAATLNLLRAFTKGGFASLHLIQAWNQNFVKTTGKVKLYKKIAKELEKALQFFSAINVHSAEMEEVEYFTSHEALLLEYEEAMIRKNSVNKKWYNCSAHLLWIGDRTRKLDSAHVELLRGINNPIGMKVGPTHQLDETIKVIKKLNPEKEEGKIILITRFGSKKIEKFLPNLIQEIKKSKLPVVWSCDPMHGNTYQAGKYKTRSFKDVTEEVEKFFKIHQDQGTIPAGIHVEMTGQNVTECTGGLKKIKPKHLQSNYQTYCDPRLNVEQSLELAFKIASFADKK
jgi:3-deoxy-7-phosphoheptulonate synthase